MKIRDYAQTFPQLINQALAQGLQSEALEGLRDAYDTAERMFNGVYRPARVPFICHLVRTASIVLAEEQPLAVVIASLLHAVYLRARFQDGTVGPATESHREEIRREVGEEVEGLIFHYDRTPAHPREAVAGHLQNLDRYDEITRKALIMRVANELEDVLDNVLAFSRKRPCYEYIEQYGDQIVKLARALGRNTLADELAAVYKLDLSSQLPEIVVRKSSQCYEHERPMRIQSIKKGSPLNKNSRK